MANTIARYMNNLANGVGGDSGTFAAVNERLFEITTTLKSLAESNTSFAATVAKQIKELRSLRQQLKKNKQSGSGSSTYDSCVA